MLGSRGRPWIRLVPQPSTHGTLPGRYRSGPPVRKGIVVSENDELWAAVSELRACVRLLEDHLEVSQLVAQYGPAVDSGSGAATAALWTEDGVFDAVVP